jgi:hypothetical protein
MKKTLLIVVLAVSFALMGGIFADKSSAFFFGRAACVPVWGCAPAVWCGPAWCYPACWPGWCCPAPCPKPKAAKAKPKGEAKPKEKK